MKKLSKLSLSALKENAESVLNKEELKTLKGGQSCTLNYYDPWGYPLTGTGYTVACYDNSTFLGYACTGGSCSGEQGAYCSALYPTTTSASCI